MAKVELKDVHFQYPVFSMTGRSLKVSLMERIRSSQRTGVIHVRALSGISFRLRDGDRLGLIGRNGGGKSSLLRVIAGLAHPQSGVCHIEGRVVPLIEKGVGVNQELSGMANIELPLRLLGAGDAEVEQARGEIPEFTGLGDFIHLPVRTYSEGMKARFSFAICTSVRAEVLVLDEWLSAGDIEFMDKASRRLDQMLNHTNIVVLASHNLDLIRRSCNLCLWLDGGRQRMLGSPDEVIDAYATDVQTELAAASPVPQEEPVV